MGIDALGELFRDRRTPEQKRADRRRNIAYGFAAAALGVYVLGSSVYGTVKLLSGPENNCTVDATTKTIQLTIKP